MSAKTTLIYQGNHPSVHVEGVEFIRGKETTVSAELAKKIQDGEKNIPVGAKHEFVLPESIAPAITPAPAPKTTDKKTG